MTTLVVGNADYRVSLGRVVRSEWTKLRSLRSTWTVLGIMVVLSVGLAIFAGWAYDQRIADGEVAPTAAGAVNSAFLGLDLFGLIIGVLGVLQMSGEYSAGLIRATLAAVPRRLPVLWAKAIVLGGLAFPVMLLGGVVSFLLVDALAGSDGTGLGESGVLRSIFGAAGYATGVGLLGLGIGALARHTAGAIVALVVALLVVPSFMLVLPESSRDIVGPYLPVVAGQAMFSLDASGQPVDLLAPGIGALVLVGWVVLVLGAAAAILHRRDA